VNRRVLKVAAVTSSLLLLTLYVVGRVAGWFDARQLEPSVPAAAADAGPDGGVATADPQEVPPQTDHFTTSKSGAVFRPSDVPGFPGRKSPKVPELKPTKPPEPVSPPTPEFPPTPLLPGQLK